MLKDILDRHRGPYRFQITRPHRSKAGFHTSEWLSGLVEKDGLGDEAIALLTDPRDTIEAVCVYSEHEGQFVTTIRGQKDL